MCLFSVAEYLIIHALGSDSEALKSSRSAMEIIQAVSSLAVFMGSALIVAYMISPKPMRFLNADNMVGWRSVFMACVAMVAFQPIVGVTATLNEQ
ncbi:MAG: hypothetical protein J6U24_01505, partial [Paludibacteraceae bacterium]|nr:hypothetical protein [Paludibacteraceae bacterium]